ncbi:MAG TPA: 50S ribosomal protein L23 [Bacteroidales bacterium]|jgi:large subunit ribosomal protein L23|nr:50S ribosomal protein L23 [Bacteroidales bacterium]MDD4235476.1 50S ribosomal protein L23 [Bacteroidales bacterium]MDY0160441.1 50S ribosomal protein L23 [Bacteroidales bacterium]HRW20444.1 50S ribosomal protein L23 [Bacteroidales bacterium]HXK81856.1 50S ribosomal protein L23 [Bacteroidales bacterium]
MEILKKPIITEKMNALGEKANRYGFIVDKKANKLQIRQAVEELYGVTVSSVNTMRYGGKIRSRFTKSGVIKGKTAAFKKAVVTLAEGEVIDFYSNI